MSHEHRPHHGHGHHEETQLDRIETAVGLIEQSVGASQGGIEEILKQMARTEAEWNEALDGLQTAIIDAVSAEGAQVAAELERIKGLAGPDLSAQFDRVIQMQTSLPERIAKVWEAEAPPVV